MVMTSWPRFLSLDRWNRRSRTLLPFLLWAPVLTSCGWLPLPSPAPLLYVPFSVEGVPQEPAFIDTGGDFEVLLKENLHLAIIGEAPVLAFNGIELLSITEGFAYEAGGIRGTAPYAIVGLSACQCNGLGVHFLRKSGKVLRIDFSSNSATFVPELPDGGVYIPFDPPPARLSEFRSSFVTVGLGLGREPPPRESALPVRALLDTGARATVIRRDVVEELGSPLPDFVEVTIGLDGLGTLLATVSLFDGAELPDLILGTDAMRAWGSEWHFSFGSLGGSIVAFPKTPPENTGASSDFRNRRTIQR